jgi:Toprim-like/Protein of unknown function (DUF3991)
MTPPTRPPSDRADREELERFKREINLTEFAATRGYRIDRRGSSRNAVMMRLSTNDDKITIARGPDQHWTYYSFRDPKDNGTVIDFLRSRGCRTLGEVRKELRAWMGPTRPPVSLDEYVPTLASPARDRGAVQRLYGAAQAAPNSLYLNGRGIRPETLAAPRFRGTFHVDRRGNVLFPHRDSNGICGFEAKNHNWTSFASGGVKALWLSQAKPTDTKFVLVEGSIDAFSYYQLRPDPGARYASIAGEINRDSQLDLIRRSIAALPPECGVVIAFDNDAGGEKLAAIVEGVATGRVISRERSPFGKDWNDALKRHEREYIEALARPRSFDRGGR